MPLRPRKSPHVRRVFAALPAPGSRDAGLRFLNAAVLTAHSMQALGRERMLARSLAPGIRLTIPKKERWTWLRLWVRSPHPSW
jgi:hypothetical protein